MKSHWFSKSICALLVALLSVLQLARAFQCSVKVMAPAQQSSSTYTDNRISSRLGQTQQDEDTSESEATYYSPNVVLDESRFRYDLDDDNNNENTASNQTTTASSSSVNEYSFFDEATLYVRAGSGGQGASTYKKGIGGQDGPPDGGNGGKGGNVVLVVDDSLNTLAALTNAWRPNSFGGSGASFQSNTAIRPKSFRAENGQDGKRQFKNGKFGKDVVIRVPPGTVVQEEVDVKGDNGDETNVRLVDLGSLTLDERTLVVAQGGQGGEGTGVAGKVSGRGVRRPRVPPEGGEKKRLKLTLNIVADVALVGVPNCGKSTFLAAVTRAKPKIANYPFTTVVPNLGVWIPPAEFEGGNRKSEGVGSSGLVLCDVPGLIAGAAQGVGLGHAFLRHVERCHVILHLIDATSNDPIADFEMLNREICKYGSGQLAKMPQVVVVNKVDAFEGGSSAGEDWEVGLQTKFSREELEAKLKESLSHSRLMWMSAKERDGVDDLMTRMAAFVRKVKDAE